MENDITEIFHNKGKFKLHLKNNNIILTEVYYLPFSKNIIILKNFMEKGFKIIIKRTK